MHDMHSNGWQIFSFLQYAPGGHLCVCVCVGYALHCVTVITFLTSIAECGQKGYHRIFYSTHNTQHATMPSWFQSYHRNWVWK